jgi:DNA-directed RNA polymerase subunit RPC12/RpoP
MPRPVCGRCSREMTMTRAVTVQFDALSTMGPYQQWQGDEAVCPDCGATVVVRYGSQASWEHFRKEERPAPDYTVREIRNNLGTLRVEPGTFVRPMGCLPPLVSKKA